MIWLLTLFCETSTSQAQGLETGDTSHHAFQFYDSLVIRFQSSAVITMPLSKVSVGRFIRYAKLPSDTGQYFCSCKQIFAKCTWLVMLDSINYDYLHIYPKYPPGFQWNIYEGEEPNVMDVMNFPIWYLYRGRRDEILSTKMTIHYLDNNRVELLWDD